ncbi:T9SS type A sorting domain-containing protein [Hymenobacter wooponensis]|uniref:T9SS type A sorting domain-containing protein n=1 Tax=Hymenobacter wooponensis TaxID=1525360 RepID=A0A4Z0MQG7_9BACT|nr:T9SS type A sorting domain-containing protein [Hymenobacter wooponensis]TGD81467.1 T9SS type A sorting domain-containing protein [Hymenobacter wooponensis]
MTTGAVLSSTTATLTVAPATTTLYKVTAVTTDCSTVTQEVTVAVQAPTISVSPSSTICSGSSTVLTASSDNPSTTYRWVNKNAPATTLSTAASYTASPGATTTYQVIATTCGSSQTTDVTVTVTNTATLQINPAAPTICAGNSTTLTAVSNVSGATYKWYEGSTSSTVISTNSTLTVAPASTTTYRVEAVTSCGSTTQSVSVSVTPAVAVTPVAVTITKGSTATLTASGSVNGVYTWTATANGKTTPITSTSATITVAPEAATTVYTVTGTNTNNCSNTAQATVTMPGGVLPVELINFTAKWNGKHVLLNWSTASEKNNAYFEVERSLDGTAFEVIEKRVGAGTTSTFTSYQFSDVSVAQLATSLVYYRLRQVDITGEATYSMIRAVQVTNPSNVFKVGVFPNPYEQTLAVQFTTQQAGAVTVTLRNMLGQVVLSKSLISGVGNQELSLPQAANLPSGVYYLTIRQGSQQQVVKVSHQ